jgi:hypothetical protein
MSLEMVDRLYVLALACQAYRLPVRDPQIELLDRLTGRFLARLGPEESSEYWLRIARSLRRIRWDLHSVPLPPSDPYLRLGRRVEELSGWLKVGAQVAEAQTIADVEGAVEVLRSLVAPASSPLVDAVADVLRASRGSGVLLLRQSQSVEAVTQWLVSGEIEGQAITPEQLRQLPPANRIVACGPCSWYPPQLLVAPRAEEIWFVHHGWLRDDDVAAGSLDHRADGVGRTIQSTGAAWVPSDPIRAAEIVPAIDWDTLVSVPSAGSGEEADAVRASVFLLADDLRVFIDADEGPSIFTVDPDAPAGHRVRRVPTRSVSPGDYLLLRTARGADDFIRTAADQLLGSDAAQLRALQGEWKAAVRERVQTVGIGGALRELQARGIGALNLRYWLSDDSIRTANPRDFKILMEYAGLGDRVGEIWSAMERIDNMHREAGQRIRALLEDEVEGGDLTRLRQRGRLDVDLGAAAGAGSLSICRVEAKAPKTVLVSRTWLRAPQQVDRDQWLG